MAVTTGTIKDDNDDDFGTGIGAFSGAGKGSDVSVTFVTERDVRDFKMFSSIVR